MTDDPYARTLADLQSRGRFGINLGLSRTRALLAALGHPERSFRGALIAGTNGKGSVLALTGAALVAAGYRTGMTPKPHLVTYRERLQIDGRPVDAESFVRIAREVLALSDRVARRHGEPTEFELLTAITFRWFADAGIDLAIVEVGLGGRLDATHAWDGGVAVVTNVALDHMDRLGNTIEKIAREKAAIIMRGDLAVTGATNYEGRPGERALDVIERRSRRVAAPLTVVPPAQLSGIDRDGIEVQLGRLGRVRVALRGRHQAANVAVADATLDALEQAGIARVDAEARRRGYAGVQWPGRLELVEAAGGREVLLDGAHNPAGAQALAEALDDLAAFAPAAFAPAAFAPAAFTPAPFVASRRPTLVLGVMADKDVDGVLRALASARILAGARVICTAPTARALPPDQLAARWKSITGLAAEAVPGVGPALHSALSSDGGLVVVAGSLYLVGAARAMIVDDPRLLPDPPLPGPLPSPEASKP